jgi:hypothetical protein
MVDFTISVYKKIIEAFIHNIYSFQDFKSFLMMPKERVVIMRHDVDRIPGNALVLAALENKYKIKSTYFFRITKSVFKKDIIDKIAKLGHEIGYHYEEVDTINKKYKGKISNVKLFEEALELFEQNLKTFREIYPVSTICMHGSPLSKFDNKDLWLKKNYKDYNIIGEPYFDIDYSKVAYITDTGRNWNKQNINIRDKVNSTLNLKINNSFDLIHKIKDFPDKIMMNTHPHRWFPPGFKWAREYVMQNQKNVIKYFINKNR